MHPWEQALDHFCREAKDHAIDFYLIGSVTAGIRGVGITPHDIDVIVDVGDFWKTEALFRDQVAEPFRESAEDTPVRFFGSIRLDGFPIDISAAPKNLFGRHPIETTCWNGHMIKSQSLELLLAVYHKNKRDDYIAKIDEYLRDFTIECL